MGIQRWTDERGHSWKRNTRTTVGRERKTGSFTLSHSTRVRPELPVEGKKEASYTRKLRREREDSASQKVSGESGEPTHATRNRAPFPHTNTRAHIRV